MFKRFGEKQENLQDLSRTENYVRLRFDVSNSDIVLITSDQSKLPGFPVQETNITFWKDEVRYKIKIFKPVSEIEKSDIPVKWLLPALIDNGDGDCC